MGEEPNITDMTSDAAGSDIHFSPPQLVSHGRFVIDNIHVHVTARARSLTSTTTFHMVSSVVTT